MEIGAPRPCFGVSHKKKDFRMSIFVNIRKAKNIKLISFLTLSIALILGFYLSNSSTSFSKNSKKKYLNKISNDIKDYNFSELEAYLSSCKGVYQLNCRKVVFKRLRDLAPNNYIVRSNYAYTLTKLLEHTESIPLYKEMIEDGEGDYILMEYYATSLLATGKSLHRVSCRHRGYPAHNKQSYI